MQTNSFSDLVREYVRREYLEPAQRRGDREIRIVAGDIHRALRFHNRVPLVCNALASKRFLEENQLHLESREGPPSGLSTTVVFTYRLMGEDSARSSPAAASPFLRLRGIAKDVFQALGGGESFIRA